MGLFFSFFGAKRLTKSPRQNGRKETRLSGRFFNKLDRSPTGSFPIKHRQFRPSKTRGSYRDQSVRAHPYPTPPFGGASRLCAGDSRSIEDYVRAVHCYAESGFGRHLAEWVLSRRQTCLDGRREQIRRGCKKIQSGVPVARQFQKNHHAAYLKAGSEIDKSSRQ